MAAGAAALIALQFLGTGLKAFEQFREAQSAEAIANYNAAVAMQNAKLILQSARMELARGRKDKQKFIDLQRVSFLKAGVRSEGTPFDLMVETASEIEMDLQVDFFNAQVAANREVSQAGVDRARAKIFRQQKIIAPLTTIASGAFRAGLGATRNVNQPQGPLSTGIRQNGSALITTGRG